MEKEVGVLSRSNLHDMLFILIASLKEWEKDLSHVPEELYLAHHQFIQACARSNMEPPATIPDFVETLLKPVKNWGIDGLLPIFPADERILEADASLSFSALDYLENYENNETYSVMKQIFLYCRDHHFDEEYRKIRTFLSKKENAVTPFFDLYQFTNNLPNAHLKKLFLACYEPFQTSIARKCPYCGWTLLKKDGDWRCSKENICHSFGEFYHLEKFTEGQNEHRMIDSIHRYVLLPGISELSIANKLREKGFEIVLYPDVDSYDIFVKKADFSIKVDVKDYYSPYLLAENIYRATLKDDYDEELVYVIPEYRIKRNALYLEEFRRYFRTFTNGEIDIMNERAFLKEVGEHA